MSLKHALLGVLTANPMNGYTLARFFASSQNWLWAAPQSQIYSSLTAMESEGLIEARREEGQNGLESKVFSLTDLGRQTFLSWVQTPHHRAPLRDIQMLQATYFDAIEPAAARAVLESFLTSQIALCAEWTTHRDALATMKTPLLRERLAHRPAASHERIARLKANVFDGLIRQAEAYIQWLQDTLDLLQDED